MIDFSVGGPDNTGGTDVADLLDSAIKTSLATKQKLYIPSGTYRLSRNLCTELGNYTSQGVYIEGEGELITRLVFDAGFGWIIRGNPGQDIVFGKIENLSVHGNTPGITMIFGRPDFSDPINEFKLLDVFITNSSPAGTAIALQLNHFVNGHVRAVVNGGGFDVPTKTGSGFCALDLRQCIGTNFYGSYGLSSHGIILRDGFNLSNVFHAIDLEASTINVWIVNSTTQSNIWLAGMNALAQTGVIASAGAKNIFDTINFNGVGTPSIITGSSATLR